MSAWKKIRTGFFYGLLVWLFTVFAMYILSLLGAKLITLKEVIPPDSPFWLLIIVFAVAVVVGPIWEEFVFRVVPVWAARKLGGSDDWILVALVLSSAAWGYGHGGVIMMLALFPAAVILSSVYLRYGYMVAVLAHGVCNAISFSVYVLAVYVFKTIV